MDRELRLAMAGRRDAESLKPPASLDDIAFCAHDLRLHGDLDSGKVKAMQTSTDRAFQRLQTYGLLPVRGLLDGSLCDELRRTIEERSERLLSGSVGPTRIDKKVSCNSTSTTISIEPALSTSSSSTSTTACPDGQEDDDDLCGACPDDPCGDIHGSSSRPHTGIDGIGAPQTAPTRMDLKLDWKDPYVKLATYEALKAVGGILASHADSPVQWTNGEKINGEERKKNEVIHKAPIHLDWRSRANAVRQTLDNRVESGIKNRNAVAERSKDKPDKKNNYKKTFSSYSAIPISTEQKSKTTTKNPFPYSAIPISTG